MADKYWVGGGSSSNWNATAPTNWGTASGVTDNAPVPVTFTDNAIFDGAGATGNTNCVLNVTTDLISITFTSGYTATFTMNASTNLRVNGGTFTDNTAHTWSVNATANLQMVGNCSINSGGKTYPGNVIFFNGTTKTLLADWTITGNLTPTGTAHTVNGYTLTIGGSLVASTGSTNGTTKFIFNGTGSLGGVTANSIDINTSGSITFSNLTFSTGTLTYVAGTIVQSGNLTMPNPIGTLNFSPRIYSITFTHSGSTAVLNAHLTATIMTWTVGNNAVFGGAYGFTVNTLNVNTAASVQLTYTNTYTVIDAFYSLGSQGSARGTLSSNHASNRVNFILANARTVCLAILNFTRIAADPARPILAFNGTVTDCVNVFAYTDVPYKPVVGFQRGSRRMEEANRKLVYYK